MRIKWNKWCGLIAVFMLMCAAMLLNRETIQAINVSDAEEYTLGNKQVGAITENGAENIYYQVTLPSSGNIHITGASATRYMYLRIYDTNSKELWKNELLWKNEKEGIEINESLYFTSGTYYFCIGHDGSGSSSYGEFHFQIDFTSTNEEFMETNGGSNNNIASANLLQTNGQLYHAQLAINDEIDFWKFEMPASGKVDLNATVYNVQYVYWHLYDENEKQLIKKNPFWDSTTSELKIRETLYLTKGTYYISMGVDNERYGKYDMSLTFTSSNESFPETNGGSNNIVANASAINLGSTYTGQLAINDDTDFYTFSLASSGSITVKANSALDYIYVKLLDANGKTLWSENPPKSTTLNMISLTKLTTLEAGTYYLAIQADNDRYGDYTFSVEGLTQENCPHDNYDSTSYAATYFAKGYKLYTCKACGHQYKGDYTAVKVLSSPYLGSCSAAKKALKLTWYSVSDATGYQVQYAKNNSMRKSVKTITVKGKSNCRKTISRLSRRKSYYVRVRAYKKLGNKTVYSKWSAKKKLKTK